MLGHVCFTASHKGKHVQVSPCTPNNDNLNQSPSCFAVIKLSPDGELETAFDLKMKIWACVGEQEGRRLRELP